MPYAIFGHLKSSSLSGIQFKFKDQLKAAIVDTWAKFDQTFIANNCLKFRSKLEDIVKHDGGWIEQKLFILVFV